MTVVVFGEGIIDFYPDAPPGTPLPHVDRFIKHQGGAPANVARDLARLGTPTRFLSALGDDAFGHFIAQALEADGANITHVRFDPRARTGITFISLADDGQRSFLMIPTTTADGHIAPGDFEHTDALDDAEVLQLGTCYLIHPGGRAESLALMRSARERDALICLDANVRLHLWPHPQDFGPALLSALPFVDILKVSDDEADAVLGGPCTSPRQLFEWVSSQGVSHLVFTEGALGARVLSHDLEVHVPSPTVEALDTTGAGDAFVASMLHTLLERSEGRGRARLESLDAEGWRHILSAGCEVGARACTAYGATTAV